MTDRQVQEIGNALACIEARARHDEELRASLAVIASWLGGIGDGVAKEVPTPPAAMAAAPPPPAAVAEMTLRLGDTRQRVRVPQIRPELEAAQVPVGSLGPVVVEEEPIPSTEAPSVDMSVLLARLRLKARGCQWAIQRRRLLMSSADFQAQIRPQDEALMAAAKALPDCYLWMADPYGPELRDDVLLEQTACIYAVLADALEHFEAAVDEQSLRQDAANLLAEAQCMLRTALARVFDDLRDPDQDLVHAWLRHCCGAQSIYIPQYMRLSDQADPADAANLRQRLEAARQARSQHQTTQKQRRKLLNKLRYHVGRIEKDEQREQDWQTLVRAVEELLEGGLSATDSELRDVLRPLLGRPCPVPLPPLLQGMLATALAAEIAEADEEPEDEPRQPTANVLRLRQVLAGRRVVFIGGASKPHRIEALKRAFDLSELHWAESTPHQSIYDFEPAIRHPDTALVLLAIRWSSHAYADIARLCVKHGKPFVRLPAGYSPEQVAGQVLRQSASLQPAASAPAMMPPVATPEPCREYQRVNGGHRHA